MTDKDLINYILNNIDLILRSAGLVIMTTACQSYRHPLHIYQETLNLAFKSRGGNAVFV